MVARTYAERMSDVRDLALADGSTLQYLLDEDAPDGAGLLVYHHGTPGAGPLDPELVGPARAAGLQIVELVRPGYGGSTRVPGRSVADAAGMTADLADHLGHDRFVTLGWSGGGPHALATAALLPARCVAAISLAGIAPFDAEGLDYLAGMGDDNIEEFGAALESGAALQAFLEGALPSLTAVTGDQVIDAIATLLPEVDRAFLTGETADRMAETFRWAVASGIWGWFDDDIAFVQPWGFDLDSIAVPVQIWQGSDDLMVPFAHGEWLAAHVPGASAMLVPGEGHLSMVGRIGEGMRALREQLG
jgi:pimeloyl-ACP methyl ester carboxylesterase